jgi:hypothetical protein
MGKNQWAFYLQDSWKATRKLTLDYGLRWDYASAPREQYGRSANLGLTHTPLTMHFAPREILVNMVVEFKNDASGEAILASIHRFESQIRHRFPSVRQIFIEAESLKTPEQKRSA